MTKFKSWLLLLILVYHCLVYKRRKLQKSERKQKEQTLLRLMTIAAFLLLFAFVFATAPAYAPGAKPDTVIDPGGPPIASTIDGTIIDCSTGRGVPGMLVDLYVTRYYMMSTTTNSEGVFHFHDSGIQWCSDYVVTVNGEESILGYALYNDQYGQMRMIAHTDHNGYACLLLHLQPVTVEDITTAALFSNTKYATLNYEEIDSTTVNHHLSFSVEAGLSYSLGYSIDDDAATYTLGFQCDPLGGICLQKRYRIASYYDGSSPTPGVKKTGITERVTEWLFGVRVVQEYLQSDDPQVNPNLAYFGCDRVPPITLSYEETGSHTWTHESGLALSYSHFDVNLNLETTVTTLSTNKVDLTINRYVDETPGFIVFGMYTAGYRLVDPDKPGGKGGMELHIWEMSGGVG